ncbi:hypothetical protein K491DRAFT_603418 [Lophiostoma macrostomum CBS 122681]|uniref:Carrier domain-containing protein n=1 Tax=Lophiostoma macrostomum CBS 122681 TaxID=1314788 RepID=A0A6A6SZN0_9PLEO|nr:hypothetical protein K491DRAFT_603418 [Lophiostoma macrostomum CBS 122681]
MSADDINTDKPLFEYEVDSLVAVELRNWIKKEFVADVAVLDLMSGTSIVVVSALVSKKSTIGLAVQSVVVT